MPGLFSTRPKWPQRKAQFETNGLASLAARDVTLSWQDSLALATTALTAHPEACDYGAVYRTYRSGSWGDTDTGVPYLDDSNAHLDKAHDLTDWDVTELAPDRYLVSAHDTEAWYGTELTRITDRSGPLTCWCPLHTKARHDFGPMILTEDVLAAHPRPTGH